MAAISSTLLALCNTGDHIVASNTIYGGSHALLKTFLPTKAAISTTFVDITDLDAVRAALRARPTKVLYTEVVSNPTLRVADLRSLADLAHGSGAVLVVDNTFTPFVVTPRRFGADVVIHSLTKFVSGASDIIAGAVCGSAAFISSLTDFHAGPCMLLGPTMDPKVASELALRLPHLALRMQEHGRRAAAYAARLQALGAAVTYPGLASHPQHGLMAAQANPGYGSGGLMGIDLGSPARANAFMERLQNRHGFGFMAVSLGYFDSLMSLSAASTSSELSSADMAASGIGRGYVRLSVGVTGSLEERWRQLEEAYRFVSQLGPEGAAPFRAVKVRRTPSGAAEQLISWPSFGPGVGLGEEVVEEAAPTRAATQVTAAGAANGAATDGEQQRSDGGDGEGVEGPAAGAVLAAAPVAAAAAQGVPAVFPPVAAGAATAVSAESGNEEAVDVTSGPVAVAATADTAGTPAPEAASPKAAALLKASSPIRSPFVPRLPPHQPSAGGANYAAVSAGGAAAADVAPGRGAHGVVAGLEFTVHGAGDGPAVDLTYPAVPAAGRDEKGPGAETRSRETPDAGVQRPVKIRRTGSVEIHYVAVPQAKS
ncbi:hypothetical protein GPECTOR_1g115 [Gonium pectorale]|uniref:Uncharacterized protein n=1 Tax=Gonium pectorale TaxID=33097 RepID=A0A150H1W0_GONPE|nr:hypothetical protein GPECTOR_1g115 [Gonium pectorale]|eukprot:KXZ56136.1 hypothetical protein GPECTOR_1g115 [Gonium pectorale]